MKIKDCRKIVQEFAIAAETKLQENEYKNGWKNMTNGEIVANITHQLSELMFTISYNPKYLARKNAVNIANYAMMFWDNNEK